MLTKNFRSFVFYLFSSIFLFAHIQPVYSQDWSDDRDDLINGLKFDAGSHFCKGAQILALHAKNGDKSKFLEDAILIEDGVEGILENRGLSANNLASRKLWILRFAREIQSTAAAMPFFHDDLGRILDGSKVYCRSHWEDLVRKIKESPFDKDSLFPGIDSTSIPDKNISSSEKLEIEIFRRNSGLVNFESNDLPWKSSVGESLCDLPVAIAIYASMGDKKGVHEARTVFSRAVNQHFDSNYIGSSFVTEATKDAIYSAWAFQGDVDLISSQTKYYCGFSWWLYNKSNHLMQEKFANNP